MTAPRTLPELYRHLHLDLPLTRVQCLNIDQLREMVRQTWHFAIAAAEAERRGVPMPEETGVKSQTKTRPRKAQR